MTTRTKSKQTETELFSRPRLIAILEGYLEPDREMPVQVPRSMVKHTNVRFMKSHEKEHETFLDLTASILYDYAFLNTLKQPFLYVFNPFFSLFTPDFERLYRSTLINSGVSIEYQRKQFMKFLVFRNVTIIAVTNPAEKYTDEVNDYLRTVKKEFDIPHLESVIDTKEAIELSTKVLYEVFSKSFSKSF
jgi:hypothetical protein